MPATGEDHKLNLAAEILRSGGTIRMKVLGTSMLPSIWPGDVLTVEGTPCEQLVPGDIVLAARDARFFVHRLIAKSSQPGSSDWITRGDSLSHDDPPVAASHLLGRVSAIQRKNRWIAPSRQVSIVGHALAWMLCHWDSLRSVALHIHSLRMRRARLRRFYRRTEPAPSTTLTATYASPE